VLTIPPKSQGMAGFVHSGAPQALVHDRVLSRDSSPYHLPRPKAQIKEYSYQAPRVRLLADFRTAV
jgi:hypothetical protein